jgi:plastocyanin
MNIRWILAAAIAPGFAAGCGGGIADSPLVTAKRNPLAVGSGVAAIDRNAAAVAPAAKGKGAFQGRIVFGGPPPLVGAPGGFDPTSPKTDKYCVTKAKLIKDQSLIVDPKTKGLKNVAVYLLRKPAGYRVAVPKTPVRFANKNCVFEPRMLPVVVGQTVAVTSEDATLHNTHTLPLNPATLPFNEAVLKGKTKTFVYGGAEKLPVRVKCDIHGWMAAYHLPLDHEFFAVTDAKGEFEIKGLPAGTHHFRLWHERAGYLEREIRITIKAGGTLRRTFKYDPSKFASFHGPAPKSVVVSLSKISMRRFDP